MKLSFGVLAIALFVIVIITHLNHPERPFFQSWQSSEDACYTYCMSSGQGYVSVLRDSMGGCMCNNDEGKKMDCGYLKELNPNKNLSGMGCK